MTVFSFGIHIEKGFANDLFANNFLIMRTSLKSFALAILTFLVITFLYRKSNAGEIADDKDAIRGLWQTILEDNGGKLIFILKIEPTLTDSLKCTIHLPELGMSNLPYGNFLLQDDSIKLPGLKAILINGTIKGRFSAQGPSQNVEFIRIEIKPSLTINCPEKNPVWKFKTDGAIWSSPTIYNDQLLFGNDLGTFFSIKIKDNSTTWTFKCNEAIRSKALIVKDQVAFACDGGFLYLIELKTGNLKWKRNIGNAVTPRIKLSKDDYTYDYLCSSPIEHDGIIYIGSKDSYVYAISVDDGTVLWKYKTGGIIRSTPTIDGELLYIGSWDGHMYALNKNDGNMKWIFDAGKCIQSSPLVVEDKVIFGSRIASIFALNKNTGKELWKTNYWMSWVESSPVLFDGYIYIGSSDYRKICVINPSDGKIVMCTHAEGWPWSTPVIAEGLIFNGTVGSLHSREEMHGRFYAFEKKTGKPVWQFKVDDTDDAFAYGFASSPTLWKDWVFVGGLDGRMYGFKTM